MNILKNIESVPKYHRIPGTHRMNSMVNIICRILNSARPPLVDLLVSWPITANIINSTAFPESK